MDSELSKEDQDWITKNIGEQPKESKNMENIIESPASATMTVKSPSGISLMYTMRELSDEKLLERITLQEAFFIANGYTPDSRYPAKKERITEYVEGRACPKCGAKLIYFESKGVKHIKCSAGKYDFTTKQRTGCDFVEWADKPVTGAATPIAGTVTEQSVGGVMLASLAQKNLIQDKWPELWREGLTKVQASQIIKENFKK